MFQTWSTKDEIESSIRTFQSVRDEIENTVSKIEWRDDENGRENLYYKFCRIRTSKQLCKNNTCIFYETILHNVVWEFLFYIICNCYVCIFWQKCRMQVFDFAHLQLFIELKKW